MTLSFASHFTEDFFRLVTTRHPRKDLLRITQHAEPYAIDILFVTTSSLIAVQAENAQEKSGDLLFTDQQRHAVEGMVPFFGVQAGDLVYRHHRLYRKRATPCRMKSAADFWRALVECGREAVWSWRATRCVWKQA